MYGIQIQEKTGAFMQHMYICVLFKKKQSKQFGNSSC